MIVEFLKNLARVNTEDEETRPLITMGEYEDWNRSGRESDTEIPTPELSLPDENTDDIHGNADAYTKYAPIGDLPPNAPTPVRPQTTVTPEQPVLATSNNRTLPIDRSALDGATRNYQEWMQKKPSDLDGNVQKNENGTPKKDSMIKNVGKGLALTLAGLAPIMNDPNISDGDALKLAMGRMLGGAVGSIINPNYDEKVRLDFEQGKAKQQLGEQQGLYTQNIANLQAEANIQDKYAQTAGREAQVLIDNRKLTDQLNVATNKNRIMEGETLRKQWKDSPTFDPDSNPNDKAVSEKYRILMGVPLVKKDAKVKDVEYIEDAENNRMFVRTLGENGQVIESGWLTDSGGISPDKTKAGYFKPSTVKAAQIAGTTRVEAAQIGATSREKINTATLAQDWKKFEFKSKEDIQRQFSNLSFLKQAYPDTPDSEIQNLREVLRKRYEEMGGNPADLADPTPTAPTTETSTTPSVTQYK
jgi:hypothetical protein